MNYLNPDNKPLATGFWTKAFRYPARIGDLNPSDFFQVLLYSHRRTPCLYLSYSSPNFADTARSSGEI